ncbi:AraC family transcriptional regulator [Glaciihabitans tibetensis]|uniref:AraC family transcriptional regulator n=1 Tax=Glaciihabitans tibetensis TaxID=1266600 RepID=UPI000D049F23|nr:helix-turn-helix domain-containing protein [Glaciihabitans tibetensis]
MTSSLGGILYPASLPTFTRLPPPPALEDLVAWFWIPEWHIPHGRISRQEVIAYPASNFVIEPNIASFVGPTTRRGHRDLMGRGWAVGALLLPAAVPAFTDDPEGLRDDALALGLPELRAAVDERMTGGEPDLTKQGSDQTEEEADLTEDKADPGVRRVQAATLVGQWLQDRAPTPTDEALLANRMVALIGGDSSVLRVEDAAELLDVSSRTLQRLAKRYVGLPPSALIRRRRLQEAALRLRTEPETDLAALAADLGYADQSHLANEFRQVLGFTPSGYRRSQPER